MSNSSKISIYKTKCIQPQKFCFNRWFDGSISATNIPERQSFIFYLFISYWICYCKNNLCQQIRIKMDDLRYLNLYYYQMMKMLLLALICLLLTTTQALRVQSHDYGTMMTVAEFEKAQRKSTRPYIVEYISNTCDECNSLDVIDQQLEREYKGKWVLYRIELQRAEFQNLSSSITLPFHTFFNKKGEKVFEKQGAFTKESLKEYIDTKLF